MSDVLVPGGGKELARKLLDAAESLGLPADVVRAQGDGFLVPEALSEAIKSKGATHRDDTTKGQAQLRPRHSRKKEDS